MENMITYEFYTDTYYGDVIPEDAFNKFASRAYDKFNYLTFNHVSYIKDTDEFEYDGDLLDDAIVEKIRKCVCRLAEILYEIDVREKSNRETIGYETTGDGKHGKIISSVSNGSESISYSVSNNTKNSMIDAVLSDEKAQKRLFDDVVTEYLSGTGLLYAGY